MSDNADKLWDTLMIGAGPAAMAAAIYTTREDISTILYDKGVIGGMAAITDWIDNYPGFVDGISGLDLADNLQKQAERFGAVFDYGEVSAIHDRKDHHEVVVDGKPVRAKTVLIGTGSEYKKIGVPGEQEFFGKGVHYCATCDGAFYREKRLVVVGGGNSAVQEALFLTKFASHIDLLVRSTLKASEVLIHELEKNDKITVHLGVSTTEIVATEGKVTSVRGKQAATGETVEIETDGVFVFVGLDPNTKFLKDSDIQLDDAGFIITNKQLETTMAGVFAAGDCRSGATMQIASATGEGATAALSIREYLKAQTQEG